MVEVLLLAAGVVAVWLAFRWTRPEPREYIWSGVGALGCALVVSYARRMAPLESHNPLLAAMAGRLSIPIWFLGLWAGYLFTRHDDDAEFDPGSIRNRSAALALVLMLPMALVALLLAGSASGPLALDGRILWIVGLVTVGGALLVGWVWWRRPPFR